MSWEPFCRSESGLDSWHTCICETRGAQVALREQILPDTPLSGDQLSG